MPMWVFCRQGENTAASHCGQGMVFAINCGPDGAANSFTNFKDAALAIGAQLKAEAAASSAAASQYAGWSTSDAYGAATTTTAYYGADTTSAYYGADTTSAYYGADTTAYYGADTTAYYGSDTTAYYGADTTAYYGADTTTTAYYGAATTTEAMMTDSAAATMTSAAYGSSYTGDSTATGQVITVVVGGSDGDLTYSPDSVQAAPGDIISFELYVIPSRSACTRCGQLTSTSLPLATRRTTPRPSRRSARRVSTSRTRPRVKSASTPACASRFLLLLFPTD